MKRLLGAGKESQTQPKTKLENPWRCPACGRTGDWRRAGRKPGTGGRGNRTGGVGRSGWRRADAHQSFCCTLCGSCRTLSQNWGCGRARRRDVSGLGRSHERAWACQRPREGLYLGWFGARLKAGWPHLVTMSPLGLACMCLVADGSPRSPLLQQAFPS